jgi:hypothetical protein
MMGTMYSIILAIKIDYFSSKVNFIYIIFIYINFWFTHTKKYCTVISLYYHDILLYFSPTDLLYFLVVVTYVNLLLYLPNLSILCGEVFSVGIITS